MQKKSVTGLFLYHDKHTSLFFCYQSCTKEIFVGKVKNCFPSSRRKVEIFLITSCYATCLGKVHLI